MSDDKAKKDEAEPKPAEAGAEGGAPAEGAAEAGTEGEPTKKRFSKKIIIMIAAGALVVLAGGGAAAFFLMRSKPDPKAAEAATASVAPDAKTKAVYFPLGDLLVNLSGEGKHPNFLKVKISLELADEKDVPLMEDIKPRIVDNFQVYLRELRIEDLRGSAGIYRLREELLMRVSEAAQPIRVRDVLFQEMLVQ